MSTPGQGTEIPIEFTVSGQEDVIAAAIKMQKATMEAWRKTLPEPKFIDHFEQSSQKMTDIAAKTARSIQVNWSAITHETQKAAQVIADLSQKVELKKYADIKKTGLGPGGIGITTLDRSTVSNLSKPIRNLNDLVRSMPSIAAQLGLSELGLGVERLRTISQVIRSIRGTLAGGGMGALKLVGASAGAGLGLLAIDHLYDKAKELYDLRERTVSSLEDNNLKSLEKIQGLAAERLQSGQIRGGQADALLTDIREVTNRQFSSKNSVSGLLSEAVRRPLAENIAQELPDLIKRLNTLTRESYATEEEGAKQHAETMHRLEEIRIETEKEALKAALDAKLRDQTASVDEQVAQSEDYTARMKGLAIEGADAQRGVLDLAQTQGEAALQRAGLDPEAQAQARNALAKIEDQRRILAEETNGTIEQLEGESQARLGKIRTDAMEREFKETEEFLEDIEKLLDDEEKAAERREKEKERILNARQQELMASYSAAGSDWAMSGQQKYRAQSDIVQSGLDNGVLTGADASALQNRLGPDPDSLSQQMQASMAEIQTQFGTVAQNIAGGFRNVIGTAVDSISNGITGLILRTKTWAQALQEIGTSILTAIISSIVRMGVQWAVGFALQKTLGKAAVKASAVDASSLAASWAPAATAASIATMGSAAGIGVASTIAAMVLGSAAAGGIAMGAGSGFKGGGYTGDMPVDHVAGVVHGKEFVFDAPATQAIGRENLEALRASRGMRTAASEGGDSKRPIIVASFDTRVDAVRFLESQDGDAYLTNAQQRLGHRWRRA